MPNSEIKIFYDGDFKKLRSPGYNYDFNMVTGYFVRWGDTFEDDPEVAPSPEIIDFEISCKCGFGCKFCYKNNTLEGNTTSFETFKACFDKFPKSVCQIAFGIGDLPTKNESKKEWDYDLWKMMEYCRANGVIPNITINGDKLTDEVIKNLVTYCGGISVSRYDKFDICYDAVKRLKDAGAKIVNIHQMVSLETFQNCIDVINDYGKDKRLEGLNSIVFLTLKKKGRGIGYKILPKPMYKFLINSALKKNVPIGFDSCSANKFAEIAKEIKIYDKIKDMIEPCESTIFSAFIDWDGKFYPCSFATECVEGIDVAKVDNFIKDVWEAKSTCNERAKILGNCRNCPYFEV